jgi:hypothetical protein
LIKYHKKTTPTYLPSAETIHFKEISMENSLVQKKVQKWTLVERAYKNVGSNNTLGDYPLSDRLWSITKVVSKTMATKGLSFSEDDLVTIKAICDLDALPVAQCDLVIDPTRIFRNSPNRQTIPVEPWYTPGGKLLVVFNVAVFDPEHSVNNEYLGISSIKLFYIPNTFNGSSSSLSLHSKDLSINSTGHCTSGTVREKFHIQLLKLEREELLGKDSEWFKSAFMAALQALPQTINAIASN